MQADGGLAFPRPIDGQVGMTLRQWYAGQALAGFLASTTTWHDGVADTIARAAFQQADAMIEAERTTDGEEQADG